MRNILGHGMVMSQEPRWVKPLKDLHLEDAATYGAKAAVLGAALNLREEVPAGFCLSAASFIAFCAFNQITIDDEALSDLIITGEHRQLMSALAAIRSSINEAKLPADLEAEVMAVANATGGGLWAVRSSFGHEDDPTASWAGQFETVLGVETANIGNAIRRCWASAFQWSPFAYGDMQGQRRGWKSLAVLVQDLVSSEKSGVAFVQTSGEVVIEACLGLGVPLVRGEINPDRYIVSSDGVVIASARAIQSIADVVHAKTVERRNVDATVITSPVLSAGESLSIAQLALRMRQTLGLSVDIEWAMSDGRLFLVQARPVTVRLPEKTSSDEQIEEIRRLLPDYKVVFKAGRLSVLFADLLMQVYREYNCVFWQTGDGFQQLTHRDSLGKAGRLGSDLFGHEERFDMFVNRGQAKLSTLSDEMRRLANLAPSVTMFREFVECARQFIDLYSRFDSMFLEDLALQREGVSNFSRIGIVKNQWREMVNSVLITSTSPLVSLLARLASFLGLARESDIEWYTIAEVIRAFDGMRLSPEEIERRRIGFVLFGTQAKVILISGGIDLTTTEPSQAAQLGEGRLLTGFVASGESGVYIGRARIVNVRYDDPEALEEVNSCFVKGEILVAETTAPELTIACNKASAIVTEIGGILSHGAIVARERRIPCIVGVQRATKAIGTGDQIELKISGDRGEIRVIDP
jgi:phosphohistidine swiveling domain-containing protein